MTIITKPTTPPSQAQDKQRGIRRHKRRVAGESNAEGEDKPSPQSSPSPTPSTGKNHKKGEGAKSKQDKNKPPEKGQPSITTIFRRASADIISTHITTPPTGEMARRKELSRTPTGEKTSKKGPARTPTPRDRSRSPSRRKDSGDRSRSSQDSSSPHRSTECLPEEGGKQ